MADDLSSGAAVPCSTDLLSNSPTPRLMLTRLEPLPFQLVVCGMWLVSLPSDGERLL